MVGQVLKGCLGMFLTVENRLEEGQGWKQQHQLGASRHHLGVTSRFEPGASREVVEKWLNIEHILKVELSRHPDRPHV